MLCREITLIIVRIIKSAQISCVGKMHGFFVLKYRLSKKCKPCKVHVYQ